jgi:hypothetical protein
MAQSNVYSLNIVGYVNVATPNGFTFLANPLSAGVTNGANEVLPNTGSLDTCEIHEWTGTGFKVSVFDSLTDDTTTGFTDRNGNPVPPPPLTSGKGWFFNNQVGAALTNVTFVGNVRTGTNNLTLPVSAHTTAAGSPLPLAGGISSVLGLTNPGGALDTCEIHKAVINGAGSITGYSVSVFDSLTDDTTTGFTDRNGNPITQPTINIAQGFFFNNQTATPVTWTQVLNVGP